MVASGLSGFGIARRIQDPDMFWRSRSPLERDDEEWQLECWGWLLDHFGGIQHLRQKTLVLPTRSFFDPPSDRMQVAAGYFGQVAAYLGIDPAAFDLVAQDSDVDPQIGPMQVIQDAPQGPGGTFSVGSGSRPTVTYNPRLVAQPQHLIPMFAHELSHALLLSVAEEPPGGSEMEEFATDLAVTFFGFGIFNANTAATFSQYHDTGTGTQGWSFERRGYLSPAERAFALAVFLGLRDEDSAAAREHLDLGPRAYFDKAERYLRKTPSALAEISQAPSE